MLVQFVGHHDSKRATSDSDDENVDAVLEVVRDVGPIDEVADRTANETDDTGEGQTTGQEDDGEVRCCVDGSVQLIGRIAGVLAHCELTLTSSRK